jgi:hypothetical protein
VKLLSKIKQAYCKMEINFSVRQSTPYEYVQGHGGSAPYAPNLGLGEWISFKKNSVALRPLASYTD